MEFILGAIYLIVTGAVVFSLAGLLLQGERTYTNKLYLVCHGCVLIWCSSQILQILSSSLIELIIVYIYGNIGICFSGAFWLLFAASYGKDAGAKVKPILYVPVFLSLFHYIMILTNGFHYLYYSEFTESHVIHGPLFYTNVAETYLFIGIGAALLFKNVKKSTLKKENSLASGSLLIIFAVLTPLLFSVIYLLGFIEAEFDITPLGFAVSVILVRIATIRYRFFDMKKELSIASEKLILEKERNRIAQQVHDTTGHTLTMLQSYMKLTEVAVKAGKEDEALEYIDEARGLTGKGIKELRESINQLREGDEHQLVTRGIMQLSHSVKEIPCEVTLQGEDSEKYSYLSRVLYDTVRESITNTLKYAEASRIDVVVRFKEKTIELVIADDGKGCDDIIDNNGLRGIRERVLKNNGQVKFISSKNEGFMTRVVLPVK